MRTSPIHYIAPSAISIIPNCNGTSSDLAVTISRGAKLKVYYPSIYALGMVDGTYQEWTLRGRNRRLAEPDKPYTIYARLRMAEDPTSTASLATAHSNAYLVFAVQTLDPATGKYKDPYVLSPNPSATSPLNNVTGADGNKYNWPVIPARQTEQGRTGFWWVKMGTVSAPDENGQRTVELDTGILGTEEYNNRWRLNPDDLPLRIELECSIGGNAVGMAPYVLWGQQLDIKASLVEGWEKDAADKVRKWTITRDSGNAQADEAWNHPVADTGEETAEESEEETTPTERIMADGQIALAHTLGDSDDFAAAVAATFTITAWGEKEAEEEEEGSDEGQATEDQETQEDPEAQDSPEVSDTPEEPELVPLTTAVITVYAQTIATYELELSAGAVTYNPVKNTYSPEESVAVRIRAKAQDGSLFYPDNAYITRAQLRVLYWPVDEQQDEESQIPELTLTDGRGLLPVSAFAAGKSINLWLENGAQAVLARATVAYIRFGEKGDTPISIYRWYKVGLTPLKPTSTSSEEPAPAAGDATGEANVYPTDKWSKTMPDRPATGEWNLWQCNSIKHGSGTIDTWSTPVRISGDKGTAGEDGSDREYIYIRQNTYPFSGTLPANITTPDASSTGQTVADDDFVPVGWSDTALPADNDNRYVYMSVREKPAGEDQTWGPFGNPVLWSNWGVRGTDGDGVQYIYKLFDHELKFEERQDNIPDRPSEPNANGEWIPSSSDTTHKDYGWSDDPQAPTVLKPYCYCSVIKEIGGVWGQFGTLGLWSRWSNDGDTPLQAFRWYADGITPLTPTDTSKDAPDPAGGDAAQAIPANAWSTTAPNRPADGWALWLTQSVRHSQGSAATRDAWSQPVRISGAKGDPGEDSKEREWIYIAKGDETTFSGNSHPKNITTPATGSQGQTKADDDFVPTGWSDNAIATNAATNRYVYASWREWDKTAKQWGAFHDPILWSNWGRQGIDGDGVQYIYKLFGHELKSAELTSLKPTNATQNAAGEWLPTSSDEQSVNYGWSDEPLSPDVNEPFCYCAPIRKTRGRWNTRTENDTEYGVFDRLGLWAVYTEGALSMDLDNEMDAFGTDADGYALVEQMKSTGVKLFYGVTPQTITGLTATIIRGDNNGTLSDTDIATLSTSGTSTEDGRITVTIKAQDLTSQQKKKLNCDLYVDITATCGIGTRTARFSLKHVASSAPGVSPTLYQLLPSATEVVFARNADGTYKQSSQTVKCGYTKTIGTAYDSRPNAVAVDGYTIYYRKSVADDYAKLTTSGVTVTTSDAFVEFVFCTNTAQSVAPSAVTGLIDRETVAILKDGAKGKNGSNGDTPMQAFQWNQSADTAPTPLPDGATLGSWSAAASNRPGNGYYLWMTQTTKHTSTDGTVSYDAWSPAVCISGADGTPGEDAPDKEWIYRLTTGTAPSLPTSTAQDKKTDGYEPQGWTNHPTGVDSTNVSEYACYRTKPAGTGEREWSEWKGKTGGQSGDAPILWSHYGRNGTDGDGTEYVFIRTQNNVAPVMVSTQADYLKDEFRPTITSASQTASLTEQAQTTDDPKGPNSTYPYEWVATRSKGPAATDGTRQWTEYTGKNNDYKMSLWSRWAEDGDTYRTVQVFYDNVLQPETPTGSTIPPSGWSLQPPILQVTDYFADRGSMVINGQTYSSVIMGKAKNTSQMYFRQRIAIEPTSSSDTINIDILYKSLMYMSSMVMGVTPMDVRYEDIGGFDASRFLYTLNADGVGDYKKTCSLTIPGDNRSHFWDVVCVSLYMGENRLRGYGGMTLNGYLWTGQIKIYTSFATFKNGILQGTWSEPVQWNGTNGAQGEKGEDGQPGAPAVVYSLQCSPAAVNFRSDAVGEFYGSYTVVCKVMKTVGDTTTEVTASGGTYDGKYLKYNTLNSNGTYNSWVSSNSISLDMSNASIAQALKRGLVGVEFALSDNSEMTSVKARASVPFMLDGHRGAQGEQGQQGQQGEQGATGKMFYPMGTYDPAATYTRTGDMIPLVFFDDGAGNYVNGARGHYYYLKANTNVSGSTHYAPASADGNGKTYPYSSTVWEIATDFGLVITQGIFAEFAKLGKAIMSGDYLFSMNGRIGTTNYNTGATWGGKPAYTLFVGDPGKKVVAESGTKYVTTLYSANYNLFSKDLNLNAGETLLVSVLLSKTATVSLFLVAGSSQKTVEWSTNTNTWSNSKDVWMSAGTTYYLRFTPSAGGPYNLRIKGSSPMNINYSVERIAFQPNWWVDLLTGKMSAARGNFVVDADGKVLVNGTVKALNLYRTTALCWGGRFCCLLEPGGNTTTYLYVKSLKSASSPELESKYGLAVGDYFPYTDALKNSGDAGAFEDGMNNGDYADNDFIPCTYSADIVELLDRPSSRKVWTDKDIVYLPLPQDFVGKMVEIRHNMTSGTGTARVMIANRSSRITLYPELDSQGKLKVGGSSLTDQCTLNKGMVASFYSTGTYWVACGTT